jgi:hypothetical protein
VVRGIPREAGHYRFEVAAQETSGSGRAVPLRVEISVYPPLVARWSFSPAVEEDRIAGRLEVSNHTETTVDLTVLVVAVNEFGKAFALGYQHFSFSPGVQSIPFSSMLPRGSYAVHADAVGEVAALGRIYRTRLQTAEALSVPAAP